MPWIAHWWQDSLLGSKFLVTLSANSSLCSDGTVGLTCTLSCCRPPEGARPAQARGDVTIPPVTLNTCQGRLASDLCPPWGHHPNLDCIAWVSLIQKPKIQSAPKPKTFWGQTEHHNWKVPHLTLCDWCAKCRHTKNIIWNYLLAWVYVCATNKFHVWTWLLYPGLYANIIIIGK